MIALGKKDIEDIILGMADIVMENRDLRAELSRMRRLHEQHDEHMRDFIKGHQEADREFLKLIMEHALFGGNANEND